ncbi:hypothetical protein ACIQOU_21170 [Streptomyces sp. NPDC091279]|uniref:hypothetical protein n=1 Tax=Streptomyces sp. NPDC091279 TaxID=3365983 RepID=UPI003822D038
MEPTGYSTDYIVDASFPESMRRFVYRAQRRWPAVYVNGQPLTSGSASAWSLPESPDDDYGSIVTFSSGQEMEDFWEENGYALDASSQGPYAVFYRFHQRSLSAGTVSGVRVGSREAEEATEGVSLLMSEYYAVSLVTSGDPAADPFSQAIVEDFVESFSSSG